MSDRACIRGCVKRDVHYATCDLHGPAYTGVHPCRGCAPQECRAGSLICDRCFGRMRALLDDAPDLLGRLRAIGDPSKATVAEDVKVARSPAGEPVTPIGVDLLDAIHTIESVLSVWHAWGMDLRSISNNRNAASWMGDHVLTRHREVDGAREAWSVQDAVDRWGVERHDKNPARWVDDEETLVEVTPVHEWGDVLLGRDDAEELAGSARTLRRWISGGHIEPEGEIWIAGRRTQMFRRSTILDVSERMGARKRAGLTQNQAKGRTT